MVGDTGVVELEVIELEVAELEVVVVGVVVVEVVVVVVEVVELEVVQLEVMEVEVVHDRAQCRVREDRRKSITFSLRIREEEKNIGPLNDSAIAKEINQ